MITSCHVTASGLCLAARPEERQGVMYSRLVAEYIVWLKNGLHVHCMRLLSWRRHQGMMLKNCILILPVSDPAKQAAQVVKHHVFDERTVIT
jgi:hypothetical protein